MRNSLKIIGVLGLVLAFTGCKTKQKDTALSGIPLLQSDMADLRARPHAGLAIYDADSGGQFTQIFGGTKYTDVVSYIDARLHYYVDPEDRTVGISPSNIFNQGWMKEAQPEPPTNAKVGASNLGVELWIAGLTARVPVTFEYNGSSIPVEDPRVGIMLIGEGYVGSTQSRDGKRTITFPPEYRQAILVHEARHSDCTGGISQTDLQTLRDAQNDDVTNALVAHMHCGHLHVKCPAGHEYAGLQACDNEAWGAYTVGEMYYRGVREDPNISGENRALADAVIVDYKSRSLVPRDGMADMSSSGVR